MAHSWSAYAKSLFLTIFDIGQAMVALSVSAVGFSPWAGQAVVHVVYGGGRRVMLTVPSIGG